MYRNNDSSGRFASHGYVLSLSHTLVVAVDLPLCLVLCVVQLALGCISCSLCLTFVGVSLVSFCMFLLFFVVLVVVVSFLLSFSFCYLALDAVGPMHVCTSSILIVPLLLFHYVFPVGLVVAVVFFFVLVGIFVDVVSLPNM